MVMRISGFHGDDIMVAFAYMVDNVGGSPAKAITVELTVPAPLVVMLTHINEEHFQH